MSAKSYRLALSLPLAPAVAHRGRAPPSQSSLIRAPCQRESAWSEGTPPVGPWVEVCVCVGVRHSESSSLPVYGETGIGQWIGHASCHYDKWLYEPT